MKVAFRYDDFSICSDTELEKKFLELFKDANIPITIGIVPYAELSMCESIGEKNVRQLLLKKVAMLREGIRSGMIEVAMHGYSHEPTHGKTEFAGLPKNEQLRRLIEGKKRLEQISNKPILTFIPPWGGYDNTTARLLEKLHFTALSADEHKTGANTSLVFEAASCAPHELKKIVKYRRKVHQPEPTIVVVFHTYDFGKGKKQLSSLKKLERILAWVNAQKDLATFTIQGTLPQD